MEDKREQVEDCTITVTIRGPLSDARRRRLDSFIDSIVPLLPVFACLDVDDRFYVTPQNA